MFAIPLVVALAVSQTSSMPSISPARIRATVDKLASWHDRNTNNPTLTEAANWVADQMRAIPGMQVELWKYEIHPSQRVPEAKEVVEVIGTLPGDTDRRIVIGGHLDTINMRVRDMVSGRAPGANDDGSGVALTLELAKVMAARHWNHTLTFVAFSGEEQGLLGSTALAKRAKEEHWPVDAVLSNDMVGNTHNTAGQSDSRHVRLFSEESLPASTHPHNSRELARFIEFISRGKIRGFSPKLVFRRDRFGRGGDHTPFNNQGFNAVRFVEVDEEYSRQHTDQDLPEFVDANYTANVARLNLLAASALAQAGPPPEEPRIDRAQGHDTTITWRTSPGVRYVVYWRDTTSPVWQGSKDVGATGRVTIPLINKDDHVFAVGAVNGIPVEAR